MKEEDGKRAGRWEKKPWLSSLYSMLINIEDDKQKAWNKRSYEFAENVWKISTRWFA